MLCNLSHSRVSPICRKFTSGEVRDRLKKAKVEPETETEKEVESESESGDVLRGNKILGNNNNNGYVTLYGVHTVECCNPAFILALILAFIPPCPPR